MINFNKKYFYFAIILFILEFLIAIFVKDAFIRPFVGDMLVVIFIYCFLKIFIKNRIGTVAVLVLFFAYSVEILQYFNFIDHLGLRKYKMATIVIGSTFDIIDILAYTLGFLFILFIEKAGKTERN